MEGFEYAFPGKSQIDFELTNELGEYDMDNLLTTFGKFNAKSIKIAVGKLKITEVKPKAAAVNIFQEQAENDKEIRIRGQIFKFVRNLSNTKNRYYGLEFKFDNKTYRE